MPAGPLQTLLTVEVNDPVRSPSGQKSDVWKQLRRVKFKIEGQSGTEGPRGQKIEANYSHRLTCRYFAGANSKMRVTGSGRVFEVVSVNNLDNKNRWLVWLVNEVV